jgi:hypothetical protein
MGYTPEMHTYEVHAYGMYANEVHTREMLSARTALIQPLTLE